MQLITFPPNKALVTNYISSCKILLDILIKQYFLLHCQSSTQKSTFNDTVLTNIMAKLKYNLSNKGQEHKSYPAPLENIDKIFKLIFQERGPQLFFF